MAKISTKYVCQACGYESPRWIGKCPECAGFSTFTEEKVVAKPRGIPLVGLLQTGPALNQLGLSRGPRTDPGAPWTLTEVQLDLGPAELLRRPTEANGPIHGSPDQHRGNSRIAFNLNAFARLEVRDDTWPGGGEATQQDSSDVWSDSRGRDGHGT